MTLKEVEDRIRELEKIHCMSFDEYEELLLTEKIRNETVDTYFQWADLVHAYRGYVEGGELNCIVEEQHEFGPKELKVLTPKRLELLCMLSDLRTESINDLAGKVHRDVKNVYQDLQVLKRLNLIELKKRRNGRIVPEVLIEEITFTTQ